MRFLLLGGAGYLGGRLARFLKSQGHQVDVTTRRRLDEVPQWLSADRVRQLQWSGPRELAPLLEDVDVAVHLAAAGQEEAAKDPQAALQASTASTQCLMEAIAGEPRPPVVIYVSSAHVYGRMEGEITEASPPSPLYPYAAAKRAGEEVLERARRHGAMALCVRMGNAFGCPAGSEITQWSLAFNDFCRQAARDKTIVLKSAGTQQRNFITMDDAVRALEFLALHPRSWPADGVIHVGGRSSLSILEVAGMVKQRAAAVLGMDVAIRAPAGPGDPHPPLRFSTERLEALGFTWHDEWEAEVDATLRLCADLS